MGKKSKRRNNNNNNGAGKNESPGHQLVAKVDEIGDDDDAIKDRRVKAAFEFYPGDMVFFCSNFEEAGRGEPPIYERGIMIANERFWLPHTRRCFDVATVCSISEDASDEAKHIKIPLVRPDEFFGCNVVHDKWPRAPRFSVGDRILLDPNGFWEPATIVEVDPIERYEDGDRVAVYKSKSDKDVIGLSQATIGSSEGSTRSDSV